MARTRSLQDMVADVRWIADIENASARHTDKKIVRALNQSQQAFRLMISEHGCDYYAAQEIVTLTAGDQTVAPISTDIVAILAVDVIVGSEFREVFKFSLSERNKYQNSSGGSTGIPTYFRWAANELFFIPEPDADYDLLIWYLPTGTDFTATYNADDSIATSSSSFDGIAGWEDWLIYDTALRVSTRDAGVNDNFELIQAELGRIQQRIITDARKRTRTGPLRRVDTRGRRKAVESANRWKLV